MNSELHLQQKVAKIENLQPAQSSGRKFVANLTTQSFVSIFHHIQQQNSQLAAKNTTKPNDISQVSGLALNPERIAVDISEKLDEKQQKSNDAFNVRLEKQKSKQQASAQDYDPLKFQDTFLGTMIAIMEAQQNNRKQPFITATNETATQGANLVGVVEQARISTQTKDFYSQNQDDRHLGQNPSSLRLVIDGVPTQSNQNPTGAFAQTDLSDQDMAISYIFGGKQFSQQMHQQLRTLTEGAPQNQELSPEENKATSSAA